MLIRIGCEKFRHGDVIFGPGLNVVLGDNKATNSIGKTTLLKVVDFVFGGGALLSTSPDVMQVLGHHKYKFVFEFDREYIFTRSTERFDEVCEVDTDDKIIRILSLDDFTAFLKSKYTEGLEGISFREMVGLVSRMWGKNNLDPQRPLHAHSAQNGTSCVEYLIKLFGEYSKIQELTKIQAERKAEKAGVVKAFDNKIIKKITKTQYGKNDQDIVAKNLQLQDIKDQLAQYAISFGELINDAVLAAKSKKNDLLAIKMDLQSQLIRVRSNLEASLKITKKSFEPLQTIFPDINTDKLAEIEFFHSGLAKILKEEIKVKERILSEQIKSVEAEVCEADSKISYALKSVDKPSFIVDAVCDISLELDELKRQNYFFEMEANLSRIIRSLGKQLKEIKIEIIDDIQLEINSKVRDIVDQIYSAARKAPVLSLSPASYDFSIVQDTGTGSAYSNLIIFDLALLGITQLPFIIHDSVLYKNIQNDAVSNIIGMYSEQKKQCFIAFDELSKQSEGTQKLLVDNKVRSLSDDSVLYITDWRKKNG